MMEETRSVIASKVYYVDDLITESSFYNDAAIDPFGSGTPLNEGWKPQD